MAGVIKQRNMTFTQFIEAYNEREKRQELLSASLDQSVRPYKYDHNLASVWALEHLNAQATALLNTFSMFHPDAISDRLYIESVGKIELSGFPQSLPEYKAARTKLLESSIISRNKGRRQLYIHRIVQDVARIRLPKEEFRNTFMACVQLVAELWPFEVFPSWRHGVERWSTCEEFIPHILRLKELADQAVPSVDDFDWDYKFARLLTDAGWYQHERGRPDESELFNNLAQGICETWEQRFSALASRTPEHDEQLRCIHATVAEILHNKGCIATEINAPKKAFRYFQQFNSMMVGEFESSSDLLRRDMRLGISWNELGNAYMLKKQWSKGERCFLRSIDTMKELENFRATDLSLPLVNLGLSYWLQGRNEEALQILNKGLKDREEAYGEDDRKSFTKGRYLHALGNVKASMGLHDKSLEYHRSALYHYKATLGNSHHRTADMYAKVTEHHILLKQDETAL
jgi:tetratricopeptide (TPR) repeat protein